MRERILYLVAPFLLFFATSAFAVSYVSVAANSGGTVTVTYGTTTATKAGKYPLADGTPVTVAFSAKSATTTTPTSPATPGYYLSKVVADAIVTYPKDYNYYTQTFTYDAANPNVTHKISATFVKDPYIVASSNAGGTVTPSGNTQVEYGADQLFSITANTGFHIIKVLVDGKTPADFPTVTTTTPTSYSYTFPSVVAKHSLKAQFAINTYSITTQVYDKGKITPASLSAVKYGQNKVFTVTPSTGMKIESLTVNGVAQTIADPTVAYPLPLNNIIENKEIVAVFTESSLPSGTARLSGTYNLVQTEYGFWQSSSSGSTYVNTESNGKNIKAVFDGKGGCSVTLKGYNFSPQIGQSNNQTVNANLKTESFSGCTYTVDDTDGSFIISYKGSQLVTGWVSQDGNSVVIGEIGKTIETDGTGYEVRQVAGVRAGTSITKSSMKGTYHLINQMTGLFKSSGSTTTSVTEYMHGGFNTVTFDGNGGCTLHYNGNEFNRNMLGTGDVTMNSEEHDPSCSYTVASNGVFTLKTLTEGEKTPETITGWGSADGNVAIVGHSSVTTKTDGIDYEIEKVVGVKAGENMSTGSVSGTYRLIDTQSAFLADNTGSGPDKSEGRKIIATFDGLGGCSMTDEGSEYYGNNGIGTVTEESDPSTDSTACSYSVDSIGAFTINFTIGGEDQSVSGWASSDGMAVVTGASDRKTGSNGYNYFTSLVYGVKTSNATVH